ncbi:MAG TPA: ABC transporter permease, partial [Acidobacteriota bacterium]|nr:ABC transporter permease [Acidobacteriota bacterium]
MQDVRYALRQLLKSPGFTAVALVTLALGIGANTAIFSVINGVLLRPLPFAQPEELMRVYHRRANFPKASYAAGAFFSVAKDNQSFESIAAWQSTNFSLNTDGAEPERVEGATVTEQFAQVTRVSPVRGRFFNAQEFTPGNDGVVLISRSLWEQHFARADDIVGRTLEVGGRPRVVIGVMPDGFTFPGKSHVWAPFAPTDENRTRRDLHNLQVFARLKPGTTYAQAQ